MSQFSLSQIQGLMDGLAAAVEQVHQSLVVVLRDDLGVGAGVVWRQAGMQESLIVTNHHVVSSPSANRPIINHPAAGRGRLRVRFHDGREGWAELIGSEPGADLALLRADAGNIPAVRIGSSARLRVGQLVFALGHPWGQQGLVTHGIISGFGALPTPEGKIELIRTDARLAPGSSGGPLVDMTGSMVGINSRLVGGDLGVAVPAHIVARFVRQAVGLGTLL